MAIGDTNKIGEAFVQVRYALDGLSQDLGRIRSQVAQQTGQIENTVRSRLSRLGSIIAAPFNVLRGVLSGLQSQAGGLVATLGAGFAVTGVLQANIQFEKLKGSLETVTGSALAAKGALDFITEFARTTPFAIEQSVSAFIRLQSLGIAPTEARLRSFGNTATAFGKDLIQFIEAAADASVGEFERLKEFGIRAQQQGEQVTFTFQGISTTVQKSSADIIRYLESIGEVNFAGAMEKQMNRLPGLVSNLQDSFQALAVAIGEGGLVAGLSTLLRAVISFNEEGTNFARTVGEVIGGALVRAAGALRSLREAFDALTPEMQAFSVQAAAIGAALAVIVPVLGIVAVSISALLTPIGLVIAAIAVLTTAWLRYNDQVIQIGDATVRVGALFQAAWVTALETVGALIGQVTNQFTALYQTLTGDFAGAAETVRSNFAQIGEAGSSIADAWRAAFREAVGAASDEVQAGLADIVGGDVAAGVDEARAALAALFETAGQGQAAAAAAVSDAIGVSAASVRTLGDEIRDVRFETLLAGLDEAEASALRAADALGLIMDEGRPDEFFIVTGGAQEDLSRLEEAYRRLAEAQRAAAGATEEIAAELPAAATRMSELRDTVAALQTQMTGLRERAGDALLGFTQGVADYALEAGNAYEQMRKLGTTAMRGLEDAIVDFAMTGKLAVKDMVASILADLARLAVQQGISQLLGVGLTALSAGISGFASPTPSAGPPTANPLIRQGLGFASGGRFTVGGAGGVDSRMVQFKATPGEVVEVFRGSREYRESMGQGGGRGGDSFSIAIDARGADAGVEMRIENAVRRAVEQAKAATRDEAMRSGRYAGAFA